MYNSRFLLSQSLREEELRNLRSNMAEGEDPLYFWGRYSNFSDEQIDQMLSSAESVRVAGRQRPDGIPGDHIKILEFLEEVGVHPADVIEQDEKPLPLGLVKALACVAASDQFCAEDRREALKALWREEEKFKACEDFAYKKDKIEAAWDRRLTARKNATVSGRFQFIFHHHMNDPADQAVMLSDAKMDHYEAWLEKRLNDNKQRIRSYTQKKERLGRRTVLFRDELLGHDFSKGDQAIRDFVTQGIKRGISRSACWASAAEQLKTPGTELAAHLHLLARHRPVPVKGEKRFEWPQTVDEFCKAYAGFHQSDVDLSHAKEIRKSFAKQLKDFRQWRHDHTQNGTLTLFRSSEVWDLMTKSEVAESLEQQQTMKQDSGQPPYLPPWDAIDPEKT